MSVSPSFEAFVVEQLERVAPVTTRRMFGGVGIYSGGHFFALIDDDRLYFKVDAATRADYEREGMGPFRPPGEEHAMGYYELPGDVLEDDERLRPWMEKAVAVAAAKRRGRR